MCSCVCFGSLSLFPFLRFSAALAAGDERREGSRQPSSSPFLLLRFGRRVVGFLREMIMFHRCSSEPEDRRRRRRKLLLLWTLQPWSVGRAWMFNLMIEEGVVHGLDPDCQARCDESPVNNNISEISDILIIARQVYRYLPRSNSKVCPKLDPFLPLPYLTAPSTPRVFHCHARGGFNKFPIKYPFPPNIAEYTTNPIPNLPN